MTATTQNFGYDLDSPHTATVFSEVLNLQIVNNQHALFQPESGLIGPGQDYAVAWDKELQANDGGEVHKTMHTAFDHEGRTGDQTMENHESGFDDTFQRYVLSNYRAGGKIKNPLSEKLVAFNLIDTYTSSMALWAARRDYMIKLASLCGATGNAGAGWLDHTNRQVDVSKAGIWTRGNAIKPAAANFIYRGTKANSRAVDEDVVAGDELDLATIFLMDRLIRTARHPIRPPLKMGGKLCYPWLIGPKTAETMSQDSEITNIWHSLLQGGFVEKNPFFSNAIGAIRNFVFFIVDDMPPGQDSVTNEWVTTTEKSCILGCNALSVQYTAGFSPDNAWKMITGTRDGGYTKFIHLYQECGLVVTEFEDPLTGDAIQFKHVGTHYTG